VGLGLGYCGNDKLYLPWSRERQIGALRAEGVDAIYREKASGKSVKDRPELEKAIDQLGTGDVLVLSEWDRCTRSMTDGIAIIERLHKRGASVKPKPGDSPFDALRQPEVIRFGPGLRRCVALTALDLGIGHH
jgi:hypothetical protein